MRCKCLNCAWITRRCTVESRRVSIWTKFDPEGLNETWGGDNWFANWVLPDPVAHVHASQAGSATMFDGAQDGVDRVSGGLSMLGMA